VLHLFMEGGRFQPEAIVAMRTAYEASLKALRDTGQPNWCSKSSPSELLRAAPKVPEREARRCFGANSDKPRDDRAIACRNCADR
jgi:hypothetical protein